MISGLFGITLALLQSVGVFTQVDLLILNAYMLVPAVRSVLVIDGLLILIWALLSGILILLYGNEKGLLACVGCWIGYIFLQILSIRYLRMRLPVTAPLIATMMGIIRVMGWGAAFLEREKEQVNKLFGYFLDNEVLKYLIQNPELIKTTGQSKQLTILFADIRGFTAQSESLPPEAIINILRIYFQLMIPVIRKHGGTVDKLMGDGIMAFFGDPLPQPDHTARAARAAIEMQQTMRVIAKQWETYGVKGVGIGIGLNTDEVVVGNIGSDEFCDYTVLGRGVNLASRLESKCPAGQIHVSIHVYHALADKFSFEYLGEFDYKNIQGKVPVYRLIGENPRKS
jgi:adenylate cyclase